MKLHALFLAVLFILVKSHSATYYVSNSLTGENIYDIHPNEISRVVSSIKIKADSILFKRGERFFLASELVKSSQNNIYFGAYGDSLLPKPVLDGSVFHFDFDSNAWNDHITIKGVRFYKKKIAGLKQVENVYEDDTALTLCREPDENETVISGQKNSFTGFYKIDSVDVKNEKKIFFDHANRTDWTGAEVVTKTRQWTYERRKVSNHKNRFETDENTSYSIQKGWGYFVQRHFSALDTKGEWFYSEDEEILYFSPNRNKCTAYISSGREEENSGFDLSYKKNLSFENISFVNFKHGIKIEHSQNIEINKCDFSLCTYGIINKVSYLDNIKVVDCSFLNMHSYGIRLLANNSIIKGNNIENVGLTLGSESKGYDNLDGIESFGANNIIKNNVIKNVGYCAIRIYNCPGTRVIGNKIENTNLMVADGGAIYSYHSMEGNKLIRGNRVINAYGNVNGTTGDKDHASGIYLDELSLHFRIDSNYVSNCGDGIYIQNSRSDTVMYNFTENNRKTELHINHAGSILNGGRLNLNNDPGFDPDSLTFVPEGYVWDKKERLLYYKEKRNGVVYVEPGNNLVDKNIFIPDKNKYTFGFRTWRHIDDDTVFRLTGNSDFFRRNVPDSLLKNASFQVIGGNVKDFYQNGKNFNNLKSTFDKTSYDYLKSPPLIYIGRGAKYQVEK